MHEDETINALTTQMATLTRKIESMATKLEQKPSLEFELCGGNHSSIKCQIGNPFASASVEHTNYVSNNFQKISE